MRALTGRRLSGLARGEGLGATLVRATVGSAGLRLGATLLSFLVGVILARELGPSGYGVYALVISTTALLTVPTEFGLPSLVTREVAAAQAREDWGRIRGILRWANTVVAVTSAALLGAVLTFLLVRSAGDGDGASYAGTLVWGVLLIPLVALGNLRGATLRGLRQVVRGQLPELLLRPGVFVLLLAGATLVLGRSLDPAGAMVLNVAATATAFLIGAVMLLRAIPEQCRGVASVTTPRAWAASAFPLALTEGARYMQTHLLVLVVGWLATESDVGRFRVAAQTAILVALPVSLLNVVVAPFLSRLHSQGDRARLQQVVGYAAAAMFGGALLIFAGFAVLGGPILRASFGAGFGAAYGALVILCFGQLMSASLGPNATLLNMTGNERAVTRAFVLSLVLSASLSLALIPGLGIEGAAVASTAGLLGWNVALWIHARKVLDLDTSLASVVGPLLRGRA